MGFRDQFRDKQEWLSSTNGVINLNTTSDLAAKYYDATLTQLCGWYEDDSIGGIGQTVKLMLEADPDFVLGRALNLEVQLMGVTHTDEDLIGQVGKFNEFLKSKASTVNEHELLHAEVVNYLAENNLKRATKVLEKIATLYPEDVCALKINQDAYFVMGKVLSMKSSVANSLAVMSEKNPLKGYVHGMFSFALEESNLYPEAQTHAKLALSLNPRDSWAIHNYAHCLEMQAKVEEGLKWMHDTKCDWLPCQTLACHQYWHTALFHINNGQFDDAFSLLDNEILTRSGSSSASLDLHDAASLMYRLELVDLFEKSEQGQVSAGDDSYYERWKIVYEVSKHHKREHLWAFNDAHYMMSYLGMGDLCSARELITSIDEESNFPEGEAVVKPLLEAMYEYKMKNYEKCADLLSDIRFDIIKIGGSNAQRDLFEQLLVVAALRSSKLEHKKLGERMLLERQTLCGRKTKLTELLADQ